MAAMAAPLHFLRVPPLLRLDDGRRDLRERLRLAPAVRLREPPGHPGHEWRNRPARRIAGTLDAASPPRPRAHRRDAARTRRIVSRPVIPHDADRPRAARPATRARHAVAARRPSRNSARPLRHAAVRQVRARALSSRRVVRGSSPIVVSGLSRARGSALQSAHAHAVDTSDIPKARWNLDSRHDGVLPVLQALEEIAFRTFLAVHTSCEW